MENTKSTWQGRLGQIVEASSTLIPILVLILGIGMMRVLPNSPTTPIFSTIQEARAFFNEYQLEYQPQTAVIIASKNCSGCETLTQALGREQIPFLEYNVNTSPNVTNLHKRITSLTGDPSLPRVLVGRRLVHPNPQAIRFALKKVDNKVE